MTGARARTVAVILAGGAGERFGAALPKQLLELAGRPVIEHTIAAFDSSPEVDEVVVVMVPGFAGEVRRIVEKGGYRKVTRVLDGGSTRTESTYRALTALGPDTAGDAVDVLLHDAVRPLVDHRIIADCARALRTHEAVSTAVPSSDTVFIVGSAASGSVEGTADGREGEQTPSRESERTPSREGEQTPSREGAGVAGTEAGGAAGAGNLEVIAQVPSRATLRRAQTPQGFRLDTIRAAYRQAIADPAFAATDDVAVVLRYLPEVPVHLVPGNESNIKITYAGDIPLAEALLRVASGPVSDTSSDTSSDTASDTTSDTASDTTSDAAAGPAGRVGG